MITLHEIVRFASCSSNEDHVSGIFIPMCSGCAMLCNAILCNGMHLAPKGIKIKLEQLVVKQDYWCAPSKLLWPLEGISV